MSAVLRRLGPGGETSSFLEQMDVCREDEKEEKEEKEEKAAASCGVMQRCLIILRLRVQKKGTQPLCN